MAAQCSEFVMVMVALFYLITNICAIEVHLLFRYFRLFIVYDNNNVNLT